MYFGILNHEPEIRERLLTRNSTRAIPKRPSLLGERYKKRTPVRELAPADPSGCCGRVISVPQFSPKLLSKELLVAREIQIARDDGVSPVYFNLIVQRLEKDGLAVRATVSKALDVLFDQGIVKAEWSKTAEGKHVRALTIAREAQQFVEAILKSTKAS